MSNGWRLVLPKIVLQIFIFVWKFRQYVRLTVKKDPAIQRRAGSVNAGGMFQALSFNPILAKCLAWKRTPSRSFSEGWREPSPPAMVLAP